MKRKRTSPGAEFVMEDLHKGMALALVEKRAAAARAALERWEKRLRVATNRVALIRKRVAYYERKGL